MEDLQYILVGFAPQDRQAVKELAQTYSISFNAAVRMIIRDWKRTNPTDIVVIGGETAEKEA